LKQKLLLILLYSSKNLLSLPLFLKEALSMIGCSLSQMAGFLQHHLILRIYRDQINET
jgi:hypothetical protein